MKSLPLIVISVLVIGVISAKAGGKITRKRKCGLPSITPRIMNGTVTPIENYPWMVKVIMIYEGEEDFCGGSLITPRHVLTAAHCFYSDDTKLTKITINYGSAKGTGGKKMPVKGYYCHEKFNIQTGRNDIALLLLSKPVKVSPQSRPICLPESKPKIVGTTVTVAGWGHTKENETSASPILMSTDQVVWTPEMCIQTFPTFNMESQICAQKNFTGWCKGDSGGPLMTQTGRNFEAIGIVSYTNSKIDCAWQGAPQVYTSVWHFVPWIKKAIFCDDNYKKPE